MLQLYRLRSLVSNFENSPQMTAFDKNIRKQPGRERFELK